MCIIWGRPKSDHYQLRQEVAAHYNSLSIQQFRTLCTEQDNICEALYYATGHRVGHGDLTAPAHVLMDMENSGMSEWNDDTWTHLRRLYIDNITSSLVGMVVV